MTRYAAILLLVACGSSHDHPPAQPDAPPPPCDYVEASDGQNATTAEATDVSIGDATRNLCGTIDTGHFDEVTGAVDVDRYRVSLTASTDLLVRFFGGPGTDALDDFSVLIFDTAANPTLLNGGRYDGTLGDHGVFVATLPAGQYDVVVTAKAAADLAATIDYKVRIAADDRASRCAIPATVDYTEAADGGNSQGNDVLDVDYAASPAYQLTAATSDAPEPTGLSIDAGAAVHVAGASANVSGPDRYLDRDTFAVQSGAQANELAVRVAWGGGTADLDYLVFAGGTTTRVGGSTFAATTGDEFATFAVKPATAYELWVGAAKGSTGMPVSYDAALCADHVDTDVGR